MSIAQVVTHAVITVALLGAGLALLILTEDQTEIGAGVLMAGVAYGTGQIVRGRRLPSRDPGDPRP